MHLCLNESMILIFQRILFLHFTIIYFIQQNIEFYYWETGSFLYGFSFRPKNSYRHEQSVHARINPYEWEHYAILKNGGK